MKYFKKFVDENSSLVNDMYNCDHGYLQYVGFGIDGDDYKHVINPYHMEGSVWTHTMMVMNEMKNHGHYSDVTEIITMLHDIGKCDVRDVKTKDDGSVRVRFFGHSGFSFYRAIDVMKDWELAVDAQIHILSAIALHGEFYDYFRGEEISDNMWNKLKERFKYNDHLFHTTFDQVVADCNGRHSGVIDTFVDIDEIVNNVGDCHCGDPPKYDGRPVVTMLIGPPACGKSTWVEKNTVDDIILSRDAIVMEIGGGVSYTEAFASVDQRAVDQDLHAMTVNTVIDGMSFIVDQTNMSRKSRRKILGQIGNKYWKKAVVFATGYEEIMRRCHERKDKHIPDYVMKNMIGSFMIPMYDEFDEIEWVFE